MTKIPHLRFNVADDCYLENRYIATFQWIVRFWRNFVH